MPSISWCQLQTLLLICLFQWALLAYLIFVVGHGSTRANNFDKTTWMSHQRHELLDRFITPFNSKVNCSCNENTKINESANDTTFTQQWEGVAVGLMLKRPKWFYRRYHIMINTVLMTIPETWGLQLLVNDKWFHGELLEFHQGFRRLVGSSSSRIIITKLPQEIETKKPIQLLKEQWVWENIAADRVLFFHGDGTLCSNSIVQVSDFNHLDYVGVPWHQHGGVGGAGTEFSIRSKRAMLAALQHSPPPQGQREDVYFVFTLLDINKKKPNSYRLASPNETQQFAGVESLLVSNEMLKPDLQDHSWGPLVVAGVQAQVSDEVREWIIGICPEIKMIYPSLHNPSCFGAKPNNTKCAESLFSNLINGA